MGLSSESLFVGAVGLVLGALAGAIIGGSVLPLIALGLGVAATHHVLRQLMDSPKLLHAEPRNAHRLRRHR